MSTLKQRRKLHTFVVSESKDEQGKTKQNVVEVEIHYSLGGWNNFTGKDEARGFYLSVKPETLEFQEGSPFMSRSYTGFSGIKCCIKELKRFSEKQLFNLTIDKEKFMQLLEQVCKRNGLDSNALKLDEVDSGIFA